MKANTMILAAWIVVAAAAPAHAWNRAGHMVSGGIAYRVLAKQSPQTLARAIHLFKQHPARDEWYKRFENVEPVEQDLLLFMMAARWADDMRDQPDFGKYDPWHYINLPYTPEGQPATIKPLPPADINILWAFDTNLALMRSKESTTADKAVALCWLFHLVGDVHQPMHTTSLYTNEFPTGDRGGTRFYIRAVADGEAISLHKFWDDLIIGTEQFRSVRNRTIALHLQADLARDRLLELTANPNFEHWLRKESFELAKKEVYRLGALAGSAAKQSAPVLPADYAATVQPLAQRRIVLAGYRLANVIRSAFE